MPCLYTRHAHRYLYAHLRMSIILSPHRYNCAILKLNTVNPVYFEDLDLIVVNQTQLDQC